MTTSFGTMICEGAERHVRAACSQHRPWYIGYLFFGFALGAVYYLRQVDEDGAKAKYHWKASLLLGMFTIPLNVMILIAFDFGPLFFLYPPVYALALATVAFYAISLFVKRARAAPAQCPNAV